MNREFIHSISYDQRGIDQGRSIRQIGKQLKIASDAIETTI